MTLENCNLCGMCNDSCSVTKITKKETNSPRGKMILAKKNIPDKTFYICADPLEYNKSCSKNVDINAEIMRMRRLMIEQGIETKANKDIIENLKRTGNPFGIIQEVKKPEGETKDGAR